MQNQGFQLKEDQQSVYLQYILTPASILSTKLKINCQIKSLMSNLSLHLYPNYRFLASLLVNFLIRNSENIRQILH